MEEVVAWVGCGDGGEADEEGGAGFGGFGEGVAVVAGVSVRPCSAASAGGAVSWTSTWTCFV